MDKYAGKKLYSIAESYIITYNLFRSVPKFISGRKKDLLSKQLVERIMLAVTEVNGCDICSYAHAKMALESGMTEDEIKNMLAGIQDDVPGEEMPAVMFAQHYADFRGRPSKESWDRLVEIYDLPKAQGILGAIRMIMWGNAYGIAWSSFIGRFKRKANSRSNLFYELLMMTTTMLYFPFAFIHALVASLFKVSLIKFNKQ